MRRGLAAAARPPMADRWGGLPASVAQAAGGDARTADV